MHHLTDLLVGVREAGTKINAAAHEIASHEDTKASSWVHRIIQREIASREHTRGAAYWDEQFPGLSREERANARIRRMLARATTAGVAAAAGATTAELVPLMTKGLTAAAMIPLGLVSAGAEMLYTTALQIDLAADLAAIYGVPFTADDVGAISTLLGAALGVQMVREPTRHDKPAPPDETKTWRVLRQMGRSDYANQVGSAMLEHTLARNALPVANVIVSAVMNQVVLRRFANHVHTAMRRRLWIMRACRATQLGDARSARAILDGAWLIATMDGDIDHQEALAMAVLLNSLGLPERMSVHEASFPDDEEPWFADVRNLSAEIYPTLFRVLVLVGSASGGLGMPERRFLRRLCRALDYQLDFAEVERVVTEIREGEALKELDRLDLAPSPA